MISILLGIKFTQLKYTFKYTISVTVVKFNKFTATFLICSASRELISILVVYYTFFGI